MSNIAIFLIFAIVNFVLLSLAYKFFKAKGIIAYMVISVIAANLQVNVLVEFDFGLFQLYPTLGNVMFAGIFLATDLLNEVFGKEEAKKAVYISIFMNVSFIIVMFIATTFAHLADSNSFADALKMFFALDGTVIKIVLVSNLVYFISQFIDVTIYAKIKELLPDTKYLWIRNNGSTIVSQSIDTVLITLLLVYFVGIIPPEFLVSNIIATFLMKAIVAVVDTPFLYLMKKIK
jgi:uncharacterized integral membrane protein (TIGR00697 family)